MPGSTNLYALLGGVGDGAVWLLLDGYRQAPPPALSTPSSMNTLQCCHTAPSPVVPATMDGNPLTNRLTGKLCVRETGRHLQEVLVRSFDLLMFLGIPRSRPGHWRGRFAGNQAS